MLKPCVVFDLDGTLADTSGDLLKAANSCFRGLGLGDLLQAPQDSGIALRGGCSGAGARGLRHAQGGIQDRAGPREGMTGQERGFSCAVAGKWASRPEFCDPHTRALEAQLSPDGVERARP